MKNKNLLLSASLLLGLFSQAPAFGQDSIDDYPVAYNNCNVQVNLANTGSEDGAIPKYYMSRNCKTLYLMPPSIGTITAEVSLTQGNLDRYCRVMEVDNDTYLLKQKRLKNIQSKLLDHEINDTLTEDQVRRLEQTSERLSGDVAELVDKFSRVEAGRAYMSIEAGITEDYFSDFVLNNQHIVHQGIKIVEMDIDRGFLSVPKLTDSVGPAIIGLSVSGQPAIVEHENEFSRTYMMHNRAGAQIVFGLGRGCELNKRIKEAEDRGRPIDVSEIGRMFVADLAPNYFYQASLSSIASYKATLLSKDFVNLFYDQYQRKSKFSHSNIVNVIFQGNLVSLSNVTFDEGRALSPADKEKFLEVIHTEVRNRFANQIVEKMKQLKLVENINPDTDLAAPSNGTERRYAGMVRKCSSSSFLGVRHSSSCSDVPIYRTVDVSGRLNNDFRQGIATRIHLEETLSQNGFYTVSGSTNFKYKGDE
ncbi:MAG: hypothetical protein CL677_09280 [Bdellovibrionaceae bacterium]|nr:hypothetical protein [Pseudobdellovibrionaceae bacterium]|tara:strand:+ start:175351 stop:176778 length:1428 start_codon:yes stop_codon:yes gene_type:complete